MTVETVLIDLDDTLIASGHYFDIANLQCGLILCGELQNDVQDSEKMIAQVQHISYGLMDSGEPISSSLFPESWITYYKEVCAKLGREPRSEVMSALLVTAAGCVREQYSMYPGVADTLKGIAQHKIVLTLGNIDIQSHKTFVSGVHELVNGLEVMNVKNSQAYVDVLKKHNLNPDTTVMVGDNYHKDILPSMEVGLRAFHIRKPQKEYPYVNLQDPRYCALSSFNDIKPYL